jgi:DNA-binding CsgD family transcriptional regulator
MTTSACLRGDGPACFLVGEPGVGKSRLIAEVSKQARMDGLVVARGRASSIGPVSPLRPFAEALAGIHRSGQLPDDDLGGYRPLLARVLPELAGPAGLGEAPPQVAFAEAVLRLLTVLGGRAAGCLLVLEDLHDADPDSLAVLDYLLDNAGGSPVTLLGALRDQPSDARDLLVTAERRRAAELLPVRPLDPLYTGLLVGTCLDIDRAPAQLTEWAWRHTAGNPLAVEELLYHLIDAGQLRKHGESWQLSANPVPAPPPSMLQLIGRRIEGLGNVSRRLLITAAVYGEQFPLATIQAVLGLGEADFLAALQDAVTTQLVVIERPGWHRFHHPLTHVAVLELASPAERRHAAGQLAEVILAGDRKPTGSICRTVARLLAQAGQPARAGELSAQAGRQALANGAIEWAVADLTEAMRLLEPDTPSSELIRDLVQALWQAGQLDRALELVDRLDPVPAAGLELRRRAQLHLDLAWNCSEFGRLEQARSQLTPARSLIAGTDAELLRIHCEAIAAWLSYDPPSGAADPAGEQRAQAAARAAEHLADHGADAAERQAAAEIACRAWGALVLILQSQDRFQDGNPPRRRILALAERHNLPLWALYERVAVATEQWIADGDELAMRELWNEAQRRGHIDLALHLETYLCAQELLVSPGSPAPAVAGLTACADQARRLGVVVLHQFAVGALLLAAGLRADHHVLAETVARYEVATSPLLKERVDAAQAFRLTLEGHDSEAFAMLADVGQRTPIGPYYHRVFYPLGLRLLLGTLAGTTPAEQITQALSTSSRRRWARLFLHWSAAVHAGRRGHQDEAERHAALAAQAAEIYPIARHLTARLVAPAAYADGWGTPIEDLRTAEAWFHEQGVAAAARSCRDLLRTLGAPIQQRRNGTDAIPAALRSAGITVREYEVGLLVGERLGNRDIGERLHISPRTVEKHIAALQTKLAVPDRRTLITRMAGG